MLLGNNRTAKPQGAMPPPNMFSIVVGVPVCVVFIMPLWKDAVRCLLSSEFWKIFVHGIWKHCAVAYLAYM
jgi:hypothetical protein